MTRDEARERLFALIDEKLPGPENIDARHALRLAAIAYAQAAAFGAIFSITAIPRGA